LAQFKVLSSTMWSTFKTGQTEVHNQQFCLILYLLKQTASGSRKACKQSRISWATNTCTCSGLRYKSSYS